MNKEVEVRNLRALLLDAINKASDDDKRKSTAIETQLKANAIIWYSFAIIILFANIVVLTLCAASIYETYQVLSAISFLLLIPLVVLFSIITNTYAQLKMN
jgi:hypothetical protein